MADLRLVIPAAGCWVVTGFTLWVPNTVSIGVVSCLTTIGAVAAWTLVRGRRRVGRDAAIVLIAVCGSSAAAGIAVLVRIAVVDTAPVTKTTGKTVVEVVVTGDPVSLAGGHRTRVPVRVEAVDRRSHRGVAARVTLDSDARDLLPGQRIRFRARTSPVATPGRDRLIAADLAAIGDVTRLGQPPWWQRWAGQVRAGLRDLAERAVPPRPAGLLPGLVLGDTSRLDQQTTEAFKAAGLTHLLAVSGSNLVLTVGVVVLGARAGGASPRVVFILGAAAMVGFVILVRPTDSVLRAAIMASVGLFAALSSRRGQALPALGAAVMVVVLFWPQMALAPGFLLSVAATLGLVLWSAPIKQQLINRNVPDALASLLAMTLAAQLLTTPMVIAMTDRVSVFAVPANLLAAPAIPLIGIAGTAAASLSSLGDGYGPAAVPAELLVRATGPPVRWLLAVADRLGGPGWVAPTVPGLPVALLVTGCIAVIWGGYFQSRIWHSRKL